MRPTRTSKQLIDIHKGHFEMPFIIAKEKYYKTKPDAFLAEDSALNYLKKAERLKEKDRIDRCLNTVTRKTLISKCEHVLIREHSEVMCSKRCSIRQGQGFTTVVLAPFTIQVGLEPLRKKF